LTDWWGPYPAAAPFAINIWALNWIGYGFGLCAYTDPYWVAGPVVVYDYSQPVCCIPVETTPTAGQAPTSDQAGLSEFEYARQGFSQGDYALALRWPCGRAIDAQETNANVGSRRNTTGRKRPR
jgi:hypothetical protein